MPACAGVTLARRDMRNSRTSPRPSTPGRVRPARRARGSLLVHPPTGTPATSAGGIAWGRAEFDFPHATPPASDADARTDGVRSDLDGSLPAAAARADHGTRRRDVDGAADRH